MQWGLGGMGNTVFKNKEKHDGELEKKRQNSWEKSNRWIFTPLGQVKIPGLPGGPGGPGGPWKGAEGKSQNRKWKWELLFYYFF